MLHLDIEHMRIKSYSSLKGKLTKINGFPTPDFAKFQEDTDAIKAVLKKYRNYTNLIVIGNGGSNTSFKAFHSALVPLSSKKKAYILTTMEPDIINEIKKIFPPHNTLVMPVSKSGTTVGVIEAMLAFEGYYMVPVTTPGTGAISVIADKQNMDMIHHPEIGGRYSGLSASGLAPSIFFDIDVSGIQNGAKSMYEKCDPKVPINSNPALQLAASLYLLDQKGYGEIFCPIYSMKLSGFQNLIVQMIHETVAKNKKGQTVVCADAPESQHHTNQRFFGGPKNMAGVFFSVQNQQDKKSKVNVPAAIRRIKERDGKLGDISGVPYEKALEFEFRGTYQDAINNRIPVAHVSIDTITPYSVGELIAFWQYVAVYSAWLRDVNAFDQPQVEASKALSFEMRKGYKKSKR